LIAPLVRIKKNVTPFATSHIKNRIGENITNNILAIFSKEKNCFFVNSIFINE
jgi:hypothetical protein